jgi:hypothetical protein
MERFQPGRCLLHTLSHDLPRGHANDLPQIRKSIKPHLRFCVTSLAPSTRITIPTQGSRWAKPTSHPVSHVSRKSQPRLIRKELDCPLIKLLSLPRRGFPATPENWPAPATAGPSQNQPPMRRLSQLSAMMPSAVAFDQVYPHDRCAALDYVADSVLKPHTSLIEAPTQASQSTMPLCRPKHNSPLRPCFHISAFAIHRLTTNQYLTISANGAIRRVAILQNCISAEAP